MFGVIEEFRQWISEQERIYWGLIWVILALIPGWRAVHKLRMLKFRYVDNVRMVEQTVARLGYWSDTSTRAKNVAHFWKSSSQIGEGVFGKVWISPDGTFVVKNIKRRLEHPITGVVVDLDEAERIALAAR